MESPQGDEQLLPGLGEPERPAADIELAARRTIVALDEQGLLDERDALLCQSLITLARQYDLAAAPGGRSKAYAIAQLHAQLLATIEQLPMPADGGDDDDPWTELEKRIEKERREAAVRDAP